MFNWLRRSSNELLRSELLDEISFYPRFYKDLKHAKKSILIESPYLTTTRALQIAPIAAKLTRKKIRIKVYTRFPGHHMPRLHYESEQAIGILQNTGVIVYISHDLRHRKIAIIDKNILYEGSLNILSQSKSREIMRRTVSNKLCKQMLRFTKPSR
jgi:phosphatidylserine/phosphatidylglycerophosphate/cardiolipin synthase-like enzyme